MFLKREKELKELNAFLDSDHKSAAMIYGVRQIGKSSLILQATKQRRNVLYYECLDSPEGENLHQLARKASRQLGIPQLASPDIISFFDNLAAFNRPFIIILDEYQYLKRNSKSGNMDSFMQSIIDSLKDTGIKLILSGSFVTDMKELLEKDNPLFNRFSLIIHLKQMDYYDASAFFPDLSAYDKIAFYSVFGGSPNALSLVSPELSLEENIKRLLLEENAPLRFYIEYILFRELRKAQTANAVMDVLGNSKFRFSEIEDRIRGVEEKNLNRQLGILVEMEAVEKVSPVNARNDRRRTFYTITNNLVRFYYAYVFSHRDELRQLGPDTFFRMHIAPSLVTFISYRAEAVARSYFSRKARKGLLGDVLDIGTYWYDDRIGKKNGEFDCVIRRRNSYDVFEVKYLKEKASAELMNDEIKKIQSVQGISIGTIGFVSVSGFEDTLPAIVQISGEDLFAPGL